MNSNTEVANLYSCEVKLESGPHRFFAHKDLTERQSLTKVSEEESSSKVPNYARQDESSGGLKK